MLFTPISSQSLDALWQSTLHNEEPREDRQRTNGQNSAILLQVGFRGRVLVKLVYMIRTTMYMRLWK